jgi:uncharacterized protein involved in outer membrane biogenesis
MSRALMFIGGLLLIIVAAALLYLSFADLSPYRPQVEALVSSALGRDFRIMGELKLKALPNPSVTAEGVTLANAEWGAPTPMVAIGRVSAEVGLWSLVSGPIRIRWLELRDVAVLLEQNAAGKANWAFGADTQPKAAAESGGTRLPVVIELASLENVDVSLRRPGRDDFPVHAAIALRTDERGVLVASGSGSAGELPFTVDGTIAVEGRAGARVGIDASVAETTLRANALLSPKQVKFDGSVSPLSKLGHLFAIEGLPAADLGLAGTLILGADRYELRDGSAKLLDVESRINARVPRSGDAPIELEISINAPNLKEIRAELPMLALSSAATAHISADEISLDPFEIKVGESDYSGSLRAALRDPMSVVLKGKSKLLDFTPVQQPAAPADASASEASGPHAGAPAAPAKDAPASKWVLGEEPLPFDRLAALTVDADVAVDEVRSRDARIHNVALALKNERGMLQLKTSFDVEQGGAAEGNVLLATQGSSADLSVDFGARDLRLNVASGAVDDPSQIPPIGLSASLRSKGGSPRALASAANGRVVLTQGAGRIENAAVGLASGDILSQLFTALNPLAKEEQYSSWECTVVGLKLTDGVGKLEPMLAQEKKLLIVGAGTLDLHSEKLDIEFNTKPRTGVGVTADMFVTPFVKVTGTLAQPGLSLNAKGTILAGGAAVLTGGISLLVRGLADRATAEGDSCGKARDEAGALLAPARATTKK